MLKKIKQKIRRVLHCLSARFRTRRYALIVGAVVFVFLVTGGTVAALRLRGNDANTAPAADIAGSVTAQPTVTAQTNTEPTADQQSPAAEVPTPSAQQSASSPYANASTGSSGIYRNGMMVSPAFAGCPDSFFPPADLPRGEQWQMPAPVVKNVAPQTIQLQPGQSTTVYTYSPSNEPAIFTMFVEYPVMGSSGNGKSVTLGPGAYKIQASSTCYVYKIDVTVLSPQLSILTASYDTASNSIIYGLNMPGESFVLNYTINGCQSPNPYECSGQDFAYNSAADGSIPLDPLFPELDQYFATYSATGVTITITPQCGGYSTANSATVTFVW